MTKIKLSRIIITLIVLTCNSTNIRAQLYIDSLVNILDTRFPQEKIYLHFDKAYYNAGETIWFKAYLTASLAYRHHVVWPARRQICSCRLKKYVAAKNISPACRNL